MPPSARKFDLFFVEEQFRKSVEDDKEKLSMDPYLRGYGEFSKFFYIMGAVFGFVASDVTSKLHIVQDLCNGPSSDKYSTVEGMMVHEKAENLLEKDGFISGSRTLLRLHRALEFAYKFLEAILPLENDERLVYACQECYQQTLAKFHPFLIRKAVMVALYALPTKQGLLKAIMAQDDTEETYFELLPKITLAMRNAYDRTGQLYEKHGLEDLP